MPRTWTELIGNAEGPYETETARQGFVGRLRDSLSRSRRALTEQIAAAAFDPADDASWERLEEALLTADVGVPATAELVRRLEARQDVGDLGEALADEIAAILGAPTTLDVNHQPAGILVGGAIGTGNTTTTGHAAPSVCERARHAAGGAA